MPSKRNPKHKEVVGTDHEILRRDDLPTPRERTHEWHLSLVLLLLVLVSWYGNRWYGSLVEREVRAAEALEHGEQYDMVFRAYQAFQTGVQREYERCLGSISQSAADSQNLAYCQKFTAWAKEVLGEPEAR